MRDEGIIEAEAHCDIPCGIYDPTAAKIAAKTVARMTEQIEELALPTDWQDQQAVAHYAASLARRIAVKEAHAEICKRELEILWIDFFKPEHLKDVPNLHDLFWKATKLCSKNKQEISAAAAAELLAAVDQIAEMFYRVKGDPSRYAAYQALTDKLF